MKGQTWWLIGASEGLGRALAQAMTREGATVIVSARDQSRLDDVVAAGHAARAITIDVTDEAAVTEAAQNVGNIDGMVWLAGAYWPMKAQAWDSDKVLTMLDTNAAGLVRILGHVLPKMLAKNAGRIVITGSLSGFRGLPGSIGYSASKATVMHLAEDLHADLHTTGVRVQLANPGFIKTRLTDKNDFKMPQLMEPEVAAAHMIKLIKSRRFSASFPRPFAWVFRLGNFLPDRLYYRLFGAKD
ncbi:MAG: SDR family NAD(P)-dependent oxidoreductase [Deltaproteobacteria bacterium]